jgi:ribosomal protein L29
MLLYEDSKRLEKALGEEAASVIAHMFEQAEDQRRQDRVTKADLLLLKSDLQNEISNTAFALQAEHTSIKTELKADIASVRTELTTEIASVRTELKAEIADVRLEIASVRTELKEEIAAVRTELKEEIAAVRTELKEDITNLKTQIADIKVTLGNTKYELIRWVVGGNLVLGTLMITIIALFK